MVLKYEWFDDENNVIMRETPANYEVESRSPLLPFHLVFEKDRENQASKQFHRLCNNLAAILEVER